MKNKLEEQQTKTTLAYSEESKPSNTIDDKIGFGMFVMNLKSKTEPYLRKGMLYTNTNGNHVFAFYKIPENAGTEEILDPIIKIRGQNIQDCMRELFLSLETHGERKKMWELYAVEPEDLARIKKTIGKDICTPQGLNLSLHRTPVIYLIDQNIPAPESQYRKLRLEVFKRNILRRYGQSHYGL